jgi:transposase InsO family protein
LKYIGALAVKTRLREWQVKPLPSKASIERVLSSHQLTNKQGQKVLEKVDYPHIQPRQPQELVQVDIVPHYLTGGEKTACFNAIDVVSRYPTGYAYPRQRAEDACRFLLQVWREMGVPTYTQVDNESCFSGGHSHPHILGKVVRLALTVGTELVFSPFYHPESNYSVERFHQDYNLHVWNDTYLEDCQAVNRQADHFFQLYRQRLDHSAIVDQSPTQLQGKPLRPLSPTFTYSEQSLPLRTGKVHFIRRVNNQGFIKILNVEWVVPNFDLLKGVWVTLELQTSGATLAIFDAAPDVAQRQLLASHPFPIADPVLPWSDADVLRQTNPTSASTSPHVSQFQAAPPQPLVGIDDFVQVGLEIFQVAFNLTAHLTSKVIGTMY